MLDFQQTVQQIQQVSVAERIHVIELILQSVKHDINTSLTIKPREFVIRKFSLGTEVHVDRDKLYAERISL
ncbi:hypothetical protein PN36_32395 [Candidatus Thiomargarita nelsonii]|uniref:Uncharacterized protein n=1 Tax=Candidatus Thiomargarita nelsonii TaxID=1003181 RepID=A0A4E0QYD6_9GAMM|nr:hypothetical protein PN36_32395 [Candidatus Thiomargarita nelsonii]